MKNGWYTDEIDNLCNVEYGTRVVQKRDGGSTFPVYGGGGATFFMDSYNREDRLTIARFAMSAQCTRFVKGKFFLNDSGLTLSPKDSTKINQDFLDYQCLAMNDLFYSLAKGSAQKNLDVPAFRKLKLNIPKDLKVQEKIVRRIDDIFAEIDKAYIASKANKDNAEALFQSFLNEIFEKDTSNLKKLKDCCLIKPPKSETKNLDKKLVVSFLPMEALGINEMEAIPNQTRTLEDVTGSYTYFSEGDVLLAKITPCFENGKLGIATNLSNKIGFGSSEYIVFRPNINVDKEWVYYYLNRQNFRLDGARHMAGAVGHKRVTKEFIENSLIPIPSIDTQRKLISTIRNVFQTSQNLKLSSEKKLRELALLKVSVLNQAFKGELVKE